jgi:hypothetical protein
MLLLPEPFGPVIAVKPGKNGTASFFPKDLKFSILTSLRYRFHPFLSFNIVL